MSNLKTPYVNPKRTICEVLREIFDILKRYDIPGIEGLLEEAYMMGKKMDAKLRQYKYGYDDGWYENTKDIELKNALRECKSEVISPLQAEIRILNEEVRNEYFKENNLH